MNSQSITAKRLRGEIKNLEKDREAYYQVVQDEEDQFLFYFLLRGDSDSAYNGGYYIGKIVLPTSYPANPGDFYMLTPSGRFRIGSKICLTNSGYHKESWSPLWNIKLMVIGFVSVFLSDDTTGISHIKEYPTERKAKAVASLQYNLDKHKDIMSKFDQFVKPDGSVRTDKEVEEFVQSIRNKKKEKRERRKAKSRSKSKSKSKSDSSEKKGVVKKIVNTPADTKKEKKVIKMEEDQIEDIEEDVEETIDVIKAVQKEEVEQIQDNIETDEEKKQEEVEEEEKEVVSDDQDNEDNAKEDEVVEKKITVKPKSSNSAPPVAETQKTKTKENAKKINVKSDGNVKVRGNQKNYPKTYDEWIMRINESTVQTHDPKLFSMTFG